MAMRGAIAFGALLACGVASAQTSAPAAAEDLAQAELLYQRGDLASMRSALALYDQAASARPGDYEAQWKAARCHREYANKAKELQIKGWKKLCAEHGKVAMAYGAKAIAIEPDRAPGHLWYGSAVGTYADGVSLLTALAEGLKDKTQRAFERAYQIDKHYNEAGPMLALGRFWSVLPWPMKDNRRALQFLREYQRHFPAKPEGQLYLVEVLLDEGGKANQAEARTLLDQLERCGVPFYQQRAVELRGKL
ncbi:MAG: hypothetical protein JXR83_10450 [Deltaproteobacteria bacterium]|nr:hypothetical protein [Deltaproteobacteria bacterium]